MVVGGAGAADAAPGEPADQHGLGHLEPDGGGEAHAGTTGLGLQRGGLLHVARVAVQQQGFARLARPQAFPHQRADDVIGYELALAHGFGRRTGRRGVGLLHGGAQQVAARYVAHRVEARQPRGDRALAGARRAKKDNHVHASIFCRAGVRA